MASLPPDSEVRARAEQLGLLCVGAPLDNRTRARVAQILVDERSAPAPASANQLLSRVQYPAEGGLIQVDVVFIPNPERPNHA